MDNGQDSSTAAERPTHFEVVLQPHRSLSPTGFYFLMGAIAAVSFSAGLAFALLGAWPVFGFFGLDVALIYAAFRLSYRAGRLVERVRLDDRELVISRHHPGGTVDRWTFQPYWVRVEIDARAGPAARLTLSSHGRNVTIGSFLTADERLELAAALRAALARQRVAMA